VVNDSREIPAWVDGALRKAVHPNPARRYAELSEYLFDLRHPNREFVNGRPAPLMERNPVAFWKSVSFVLALVVAFLLSALHRFY
jgi:hypothetical protein